MSKQIRVYEWGNKLFIHRENKVSVIPLEKNATPVKRLLKRLDQEGKINYFKRHV